MRVLKIYLLVFVMALVAQSCDRTEDYFNTLVDIPQLDLSKARAYKTSYAIGDTLWIFGKFQQPRKEITVTIGNTLASIARNEKVAELSETTTDGRIDTLDRLAIVITEEMGIGKNRPVTLRSGDNLLNCPGIEIRDKGISFDPYAFDAAITLAEYHTLPANVLMAELVNGKGSIYYFNLGDKQFYAVKNGKAEVVLNADILSTALNTAFSISTVYALTVDSKEEYLYFSARANNNYLLIKYSLLSGQAQILNARPTVTSGLNGTYKQGDMIGSMEFVLWKLLADGKGNLYGYVASAISGTTATNAGTIKIAATGQISYLYKPNGSILPGTVLNEEYSVVDNAVISIEDERMYMLKNRTITQYEWTSLRKLNEVSPAAATQNPEGKYVGLFGQINLPQWSKQTTLPLVPGKFLVWNTARELYVIDFEEEKVVLYAPDCDWGSYTFSSSENRILNYDESGHLYMIYGKENKILKTQLK